MDLRKLSDSVSASDQLTASDMASLAVQGVGTVIDNRPDSEVGADRSSDTMRSAAEAAGLTFCYLPFDPTKGPTAALVAEFAAALDLPGSAVAYCRSGTRSANLWALAQRGRLSPDEVMAAGASAGYDLSAAAAALR